MNNHPHRLPQDIYDVSLHIISNVNFSRREIDIIACLLSGRTAKTIANLLSITPRTVQAHTRNITLKLEKNSREGIRDFIEKSDKFSIIKDYYVALLAQCAFEKRLRIIAKRKITRTCLIMYYCKQKYTPTLATQMEEHLKMAGVMLISDVYENIHDFFYPTHHKKLPTPDYRICIVDETFLRKSQNNDQQSRVIASSAASENDDLIPFQFLLLPREQTTRIPQEISDAGYIDSNSQENYYALFFEVLKRIIPLIDLDEIITDFNREYESIAGSGSIISSPPLTPKEEGLSPFQAVSDKKNAEAKEEHLYSDKKPFFQWKSWIFVSALVFMGVCSSNFLFFKGRDKKTDLVENQGHHLEQPIIRSDLIIPNDNIILHRPEITAEIDKNLTIQNGIQIVALIGAGGSGKTTLARHYARSQSVPFIWEINAETHENLMGSFENIAYTLSTTSEDKKFLEDVQSIKNPEKREHKILLFVKEKLKNFPDWLLIYDNVENFQDIQAYFPQDSGTWGNGKVILTTRNSNIQSNNNINHVIFIEMLSAQQKLDLFMKIMNNRKTNTITPIQQEEIIKFLESIPSFPLDVSVAACYLKITNISYKSYLDILEKYDRDFVDIQKNILKDSGNYIKTRHGIIKLSINNLININNDFRDLLLFISLLDSQYIPIDFLKKYKAENIVDNFIYNLKNHSLILNESSHPTALRAIFSLYRSTQSICLAYFVREMKKLGRKRPSFKTASAAAAYPFFQICPFR